MISQYSYAIPISKEREIKSILWENSILSLEILPFSFISVDVSPEVENQIVITDYIINFKEQTHT